MHKKVRFHQLADLSDGQLIMMTGHYLRHARGSCLYLGDQSLTLAGEPFTWIPPQFTLVDIWGELLQGDTPRLFVHDARPTGTDEPPVMVNAPLTEDGVFISLVRVRRIGHRNVAITPDKKSLVIDGDAPDEGVYVIEGTITSLDPPVLEIGMYVAMPFVYVDNPSNFYLWPHA